MLCAVLGIGVVALREPHLSRTRGPIRIAKPAVPAEIRGDFWFAALGVTASWSVLGVLLSLYPSLAAQQTHVHNLVFGGAVVGTTAFSAAMAQLFSTRVPARRSAIIGDVGMAVALILTVPVLATHSWPLVLGAAALLGATFGLGFGGSLRHLSHVVPADRRGETMSAFYLMAYTAMAVPTIVAGWAATRWPLGEVFPWFAYAVAVGVPGRRRRRRDQHAPRLTPAECATYRTRTSHACETATSARATLRRRTSPGRRRRRPPRCAPRSARDRGAWGRPSRR